MLARDVAWGGGLMVEQDFIALAMGMGVGTRISRLRTEIDQTIRAYPPTGDERWLVRLEAQRRLLAAPTLRVIVALTVRLCEESPEAAAKAAPLLDALVLRDPGLASLTRRLTLLERRSV
jgi:hypothetical protein